MSESYKMSALFRPQRQNRMKCQRRQIKIHLNRTIIAVNHPLYTFQPESMSLVVVFTGNQSPAGTGKRISKTGVYDSDNGKRRVRLGIGVQFNKTIRNGSSRSALSRRLQNNAVRSASVRKSTVWLRISV